MINPINFRASAAIAPVKLNEQEAPKAETVVTNPIDTEVAFKGAEAIANYNKAILVADTIEEEASNAPAFKGEEVADETESDAV